MLFSVVSFSQTITVDNTANSPADLVNLLLGNSCVAVSNISISSNQSVGYFNQNGSSFPINQGIILRSGNILNTQGLYTGSNLSTTASGGGADAFLQNLSNTSSGTTVPLTDLSFLQFDFVPISSSFSFDFLFASNEYGQFQCLSNDIFAFELTNIATGVTTNLGVISATSNPVTVKNIKNSIYNSTCSSTNPSLFGVYNVGNPAASTLNMLGHTVVLNASSAVIPNTAYRLKFVIADYGDTDYDSSVFISGGSFTNTLNLGIDQTICAGNTFVLDTQLDTQLDTTYTYQWYQDGNPVGGNTSTFTVNAPGTYSIEITKGTCVLTDTIVFNNLSVTNPINLQTCNSGAASYIFNLTNNNETQLGINNTTYDVYYYTSLANAAANIPIGSPSSFSTSTNRTIYLKIFSTVTNQFCNAVYQFDLLINASVNVTQPNDVELCETTGVTTYLLAALDSQVLNGQTGYNVLYYTFQADAVAGNGAVISSVTIPNGTSIVTIWIRMQDSTNTSCFDVTSVDIIVNPLPPVDDIADVVECSSYILPVITNGNYYTGPNGTGTPLFAGNSINLGGIYYIYNGPGFNESSFTSYFIDEYVPVLDNCGEFIVPATPYGIGAFYTAIGGPTGTGVVIPQGTIYTNSTSLSIVQTLFYYAEVNNVFCRDEQFDVNIHPLPLVDDPEDVTFCNTYTLPVLTNGNYYSGSGGTGTPYFAGDNITISQTMYVYNSKAFINVAGNPGVCGLENNFLINIVDTSLFTNISACVSYTLPAITYGGYFTSPLGGGTAIDPNIPIKTSQIVYYFTNTSVLPNCTDYLNYNITINPLPAVDSLPSGTFCGEFILPTLTNGTYYTLSGGPNTVGQTTLSPGQIIDLSGTNLTPGTYYVFSGPDANTCVQETSFTIAITPLPIVDEYINRVLCNQYSIPAPTVGQIYTNSGGPTGIGVLVSPSDVFSADQRFYLYYQDPLTLCVVDKPFEMYYNGINLPNYTDVNVCDSYTLPALTHVPPEPSTSYTIGYYYNNDGTNPVPNGTVFTPLTANPISVFVYAVNNGRFGVSCVEVDEIVITFSATPVITPIVFDADECGTYVLPTLPTVGYTIGYFTSPNGVGPITNLNITNTGTTSQTYTYYVYATATNNVNCHSQQEFSFTIHPILDLTLQDGIICVDPITNGLLQSHTIYSGLNPAEFNVNWFLNGNLMGTGVSYTAVEAGVYTVEFIKLTPEVGTDCNYRTTTVTIVQSSPAVANFTVSQEFDTNNTLITVNVTNGFGNYLFQLEYSDGSTGAFQSSNVFTNLQSGEYFVNIYDTLGNCTKSRIGPIYIVNFPNYFTPNGDGIHENWNITDLAQQPSSTISIFDRYGKLLKQISPSGIGWDGKYNGQDLPSTDYWFSVEFTKQNNEKGVFKSHFTLKR